MQRPERSPGSRTFINAGAGPRSAGRVCRMFDAWREIRVDLDPAVAPELVASIMDLGEIPSGAADAVWTAHCLEHLFAHEVPKALAEFRRVLNDHGFLCLFVPDLQAAAEAIVEDRLMEPLYEAPAGPVSAHDTVFGFGAAIARGRVHMAHRCGFTASVLGRLVVEAGYEDVTVRRRKETWELVVLAAIQPFGAAEERAQLMTELAI